MRVELDLTDPASATFVSRTTIRFESCRRTFVIPRPEAPLGGLERYRAGPRRLARRRLPVADLAPVNTLVVGRDTVLLGKRGPASPRRSGSPDIPLCDILPRAAPRWFACFDQPDLKAPYIFDIPAPADWTHSWQRTEPVGRTRPLANVPSGRSRPLHDARRRRMRLGGPRRARRHPAQPARTSHAARSAAGWVGGHLTSPSSASTTPPGSELVIRSRSTTRPSCRTSTPARWRIRAA